MNDKEKARLCTTSGVRSLNVRYITIADNIPDHWESLIEIAKSSYTYYWYIQHGLEGDPHLHLVCYDKAGTSLRAHCERFSSVVPANMICKVKSPRAILRYLIHKDSPDKEQYFPEQVVSNNMDYFLHAIDELHVDSQFDDYLAVMKGEISAKDFIKKYEHEFVNLSLSQKVSIYHSLTTGIRYE